eukprot:TRINITY_DN35222_c0_g1_i1.p2 TRINITY_DN35222_c0_g1~~TRINITY_DN35222_c0_g1_i1.p2  ORF type:complete len:121 (-),score=2.07 TRINITY_DN35222_c0_g1_i1:224-586(-)
MLQSEDGNNAPISPAAFREISPNLMQTTVAQSATTHPIEIKIKAKLELRKVASPISMNRGQIRSTNYLEENCNLPHLLEKKGEYLGVPVKICRQKQLARLSSSVGTRNVGATVSSLHQKS